MTNNIFLKPFSTPHGAIPFDKITTALFEPAIMQGMKEQDQEIAAIIGQEAAPTFENTVVALERSGDTLSRVLGVFYPLLSADADDELMAVSTKMTPLLSEHSTRITLNHDLWLRIKAARDSFDASTHSLEDQRLLDQTCRAFERSGANLEGDDRKLFSELTKKLSKLCLTFEQNELKENAKFELWLTTDDLDGLPESAVEAAHAAAQAKGCKGGDYLVTLQAPSYRPFMKYSTRRDLRHKLYLAYNTQCTQGEFSNMQVIQDIASTRLQLARLMGYNTFADYRLPVTMAGSTQAVMQLLDDLRTAYLPAERQEMASLEAYAAKLEGHPVSIQPWDYSFYANKQCTELYGYDDEDLRPYFELHNVIRGVLGLATKLYGLQFAPVDDAPVFNPDMKVFNVTDAQGAFVGMLYTDFFPRPTKQSGAWMTNFREQWVDAQGHDVRPLVTLTMNFTKPTATKPSLLTFGEVRTFLHEFGHALHSLLSKCHYVSLSGTNVRHDFVELPSQFNENYIFEREFLDGFARHYITGEKIPQDLIDRVLASSRYGAGYACVRQLSFGYLDMAWHTITEPFKADPIAFEQQAMSSVRAFQPVEGCAMSPQFGHIFSGGYAAGYYGYKWSEVLAADAFSKFAADGIFNPATAASFRDNVLSRGDSDDPMTLYERFRGRKPTVDAILRRDGLK